MAQTGVTFDPFPFSPLGALLHFFLWVRGLFAETLANLAANKGVGRRSLWLERFGPCGPNRKIWGVFIQPLKNSVIGGKIIFLRHLICHYALNKSTSCQVYGTIL